MSVQYICENGQPAFAVLPIEEYNALAAAYENNKDIAAYDRAKEENSRARQKSYPVHLVEKLLSGANPLKAVRQWRGLSVAELASRLGVTCAHIYQIESGKREMSVSLLRKLTDILDVDADLLI